MSKLAVTCVVVGAALLSAAPFSLRFSPANSVSIALDTANAVICRSLTPLSIAGVHRKAMRRAYCANAGGCYPYRSYGYGCGRYNAYRLNAHGYYSYQPVGSWNSYSSTWYSPFRRNGGYSSAAYNPYQWNGHDFSAYNPFQWGGG
jgi:hypothetical protein